MGRSRRTEAGVFGPTTKRRRPNTSDGPSTSSVGKENTTREGSGGDASPVPCVTLRATTHPPLTRDKGVKSDERDAPNPSLWDTTLMVDVPSDFSLASAVCSYGYFVLPPNVWKPAHDPSDKDAGTFCRPLRYGESLQNTAKCRLRQVIRSGRPPSLVVDVGAKLPRGCEGHILSQVQLLMNCDRPSLGKRMLRTDLDMSPWYKLNPEAEQRGFGRLFRSPTLFEDMVKTITACNMAWKGTIRMNRLLCEEFGKDGSFPTPEDLQGVQCDDLKDRCKVGYRADRILRLADAFVEGRVDPSWLEHPDRSRDEVYKFVKNLYGFGEFAASNVLQLIGHFDCFPLDSETVRHFREAHGVVTKSVAEVAPKARKRYDPFHPYQFLAYWFEMWCSFQKKNGGIPASQWSEEQGEKL